MVHISSVHQATVMFLDWGMKTDYPDITHPCMGRSYYLHAIRSISCNTRYVNFYHVAFWLCWLLFFKLRTCREMILLFLFSFNLVSSYGIEMQDSWLKASGELDGLHWGLIIHICVQNHWIIHGGFEDKGQNSCTCFFFQAHKFIWFNEYSMPKQNIKKNVAKLFFIHVHL